MAIIGHVDLIESCDEFKEPCTGCNYNPGHNILELYNILVQIQFTTSKTKLDI